MLGMGAGEESQKGLSVTLKERMKVIDIIP